MGNKGPIHFWVNHSMRDVHVFLGVVAVVSQVIGKISENPKLPVFGDIVALAAVAHFFIHGYFHRQQKFVSDHQKVYSLPKKKIAKIGSLYLVFFMAAAGIGISIIKEIYTGTLIAKLKMMVLYLLGKVFGAVFETDGLGRDDLMVQNNHDLLEAMDQVSAKAESPWEQVMNRIQTILIVIGVIFLIVLCILAVVNYIRRLMERTGQGEGRKEGRNVADRERRLGGKESRRDRLFDFSPAAKIRRIYRRCINRQKRAGQVVAEWMTPSEIEGVAGLPCEEKYQELHRAYEKARYSESGCTEEDVQRVKTLKV